MKGSGDGALFFAGPSPAKRESEETALRRKAKMNII
jgi:hypothetical protein